MGPAGRGLPRPRRPCACPGRWVGAPDPQRARADDRRAVRRSSRGRLGDRHEDLVAVPSERLHRARCRGAPSRGPLSLRATRPPAPPRATSRRHRTWLRSWRPSRRVRRGRRRCARELHAPESCPHPSVRRRFGPTPGADLGWWTEGAVAGEHPPGRGRDPRVARLRRGAAGGVPLRGTRNSWETLPGVHLLGIRPTPTSPRGCSRGGRPPAIGCFCIGTNQVDLTSAAQRHRGVQRAVLQHPQRGRAGDRRIIASAAGWRRRPSACTPGSGTKSAKGSHEIRGRTLGIVGTGKYRHPARTSPRRWAWVIF